MKTPVTLETPGTLETLERLAIRRLAIRILETSCSDTSRTRDTAWSLDTRNTEDTMQGHWRHHACIQRHWRHHAGTLETPETLETPVTPGTPETLAGDTIRPFVYTPYILVYYVRDRVIAKA